MHHNQGIVVDVDDARLWSGRLSNFMGVISSRQTGVDVKELTDPCLTNQVSDGVDEEPR